MIEGLQYHLQLPPFMLKKLYHRQGAGRLLHTTWAVLVHLPFLLWSGLAQCIAEWLLALLKTLLLLSFLLKHFEDSPRIFQKLLATLFKVPPRLHLSKLELYILSSDINEVLSGHFPYRS